MKKFCLKLSTLIGLAIAILVGCCGWGYPIHPTAVNLRTAAATTEVATVQEFLKLAQNCTQLADYSIDLTVNLTADLDFTGVNFTPVGNFAGTFNGNGHTLSNISVHDGALSTAVFQTVAHTATITDLQFTNLQLDGDNYVGLVGKNYGTLSNITVNGKITGKNFVGGIAAYNGCSSQNDADDETDDNNPNPWNNVESYAQITNCQNHATTTGQTYVGGLAGNNVGTITDCTNHAPVNGHKNTTNSTVVNIGGIAGNNDYRVMNCTNYAVVNGAEDSTAVGGICGLSTGEIYFVQNHGAVNGTHYVGGICGLYGALAEAEGGEEDEPTVDLAPHQITYTINQAPVTAVSHAGGILGYATTTNLNLNNAVSTGDVTVTAGNYAGGIVGYAQNVTIRSVTSAGTITAKGLNVGQYVGGIAGYADHITAASSTATLKGADYLGGIAGYASDVLRDCYTNALLLPNTNSTYVGLIAGASRAFNASLNTFGDSVKNNYYIGDQGGIQGTQYAAHFNNAAANVTTEQLTTLDLNSTDWQNGDATTYPTLRYLQNVEMCAAFDDTTAWEAMFAAHAEKLTQLTKDNARVTYTVVFREWNQDNGDLTDDDGQIQFDNFDTIATLRVTADDTITVPTLHYATCNANGVYTYKGDQAKYFVTLSAPNKVTANTTIYAQYTPIVTTLATADRQILVEGEFAQGTTVELLNDDGRYTLRFICDGQELNITSATVKIKPNDRQNSVYVLNGDQATKVTATTSGDYLAFHYDGNAFRLNTDRGFVFPVWGWVLIGVGAVILLSAIIIPVVVIKHKKH